MKKLICAFFLSLALYSLLALLPVEGQQGQPVEGVVRFHVIANSDSSADQELKLAVRDEVLAYLRPELENVQDKETAAQIIQSRLSQIEEVAEGVLCSQGCSDQVKAYYGVFDFPARTYGEKTFPEGKYEALRIVLGAGGGKNWWCCLFPPLCYADLTNTARQFMEGETEGSERLNNEAEGDAETNEGEGEKYYLTSKIGEWLENSKDNPILSWLWPYNS
ncbi:MAG TPA: stage II sporulation protein R [Syntrophaceticus sp.]|nr:stage II sporulation protein R [Syntrophaceticus sp.]